MKYHWKMPKKKVSNRRNIFDLKSRNFRLHSISSKSHKMPVKWIRKWSKKYVLGSRESDLQDATYCEEICQNLFILWHVENFLLKKGRYWTNTELLLNEYRAAIERIRLYFVSSGSRPIWQAVSEILMRLNKNETFRKLKKGFSDIAF